MMAFLDVHLENSNWKNPYKSSEKAAGRGIKTLHRHHFFNGLEQ